jgi:hypothetical protein
LLLVFLIRPLVKGLWTLDGVAWLPLLAFAAVITLFPAYGFRPECIPLLINHGVLALISLGPLLMGARRNAAFHEQGGLFAFSALVCLILFTGVALWFAPQDLPPAPARLVEIRDPDTTRRYTLHVFDGEEAGPVEGRPLIFVVPPEFGQAKAVNSICAALEARGFAVITYTRQGFSSPARLYRLWRSFIRGTVFTRANEQGRSLENELRREIQFVLPHVKENLGDLAPGADSLFLAGWGAGGSALVYLASQPSQSGDRLPGHPGATLPLYGAKALVVVESRLWSAWEAAPPPDPLSGGSNPALQVLAAVGNWFARFLPEKIKGPGPVPRPQIPMLYLVSDRAFDPEQWDYAALFHSLRDSMGPVALAAMEGAGPLDYTDFPTEYPLYTSLFSGYGESRDQRGARTSRSRVTWDTAALIARFCELAAGDNSSGGGSPGRTALHLETRYWNFGDLRVY